MRTTLTCCVIRTATDVGTEIWGDGDSNAAIGLGICRLASVIMRALGAVLLLGRMFSMTSMRSSLLNSPGTGLDIWSLLPQPSYVLFV